MSKKWNLQDIQPVERKKRRPVAPPREIDTPVYDEQDEDRYEEETPEFHSGGSDIVIQDHTKKERSILLYAIIAFVVIVGGAIALSAVLGRTVLTIYPENREPNINTDFTAYPDNRADALSYEILTLEATAESQVAATGQIQVEEQASGVIEIIKTTPGAERLIKNTRFRTPEGLIYRIEESVVVPGAVTDSTGATVPGSIQAEVFADDIGEEYNIPAGVRFDIPGFEEAGLTDLYESVYAQTNQPIEGGFAGPQFQIDDSELQTARQALQQQLRNELLERIDSERPTGFISFPGAVAISYTELPAVEYGEDLVTIREQAVLQVPLFEAIEFGSFLANEAVATYDGGPVRVEDPAALTFRYTSPTTSASIIANETSLEFNLTGRPLLVWEYDVEALKRDLAGLPKTAVPNAISAYPGISGARVSITPFWHRSFPENPDDIEVIEEIQAD